MNRIPPVGGEEIDLVPNSQNVAVLIDEFLKLVFGRLICVSSIAYMENEIGLLQSFGRPGDPLTLDFVACFSKSRSIPDLNWPTVEGYGRFQFIASCSGLVVNDGSLISDKRVDKAALADVWFTNNCDLPRSGQVKTDSSVVNQRLKSLDGNGDIVQVFASCITSRQKSNDGVNFPGDRTWLGVGLSNLRKQKERGALRGGVGQ